MTDESIRGDVEESISKVMDPCSIAMGRPLDLVTMGLVEGITVQRGQVAVELVLTDPNCFLQTEIVRAVEQAVREVPGVDGCTVVLSGDVLWTSERIRVSPSTGMSAAVSLGMPTAG